MMRASSVVLCVLSLACAFARAGGQEVMIGVAREDITPDGPIRLSGYAVRNAESTGVEQPIWAKAIAIGSDAEKPAVIVAVDSIGVHESLVEDLAARLSRRAGVPRERLAVASTHTHSAPCLAGNMTTLFSKPMPADQQARVDRYTRTLVERLEHVCLAALASRKPGRLAWARGRAGFAANRRTRGGPVDHSLPVLKATAPDGTLRAVVLNYACHCTTIDPKENLVSGDWAGHAQAAIEADHPGCVALTLIGCGADANPTQQFKPGAALAHGREIAAEVGRLLQGAGAWTDLPAPTEARLERVSLPYDHVPTREELERLVKAGGPPGYTASVHLAALDRGEALPATLPYSTQAWRFGEKLLMVFLPGEVVADYVLRLKKELDPRRLWVTAYTNDAPCYIPSERVLRAGGYEGGGAMVYYGRPSKLKAGVEGLIVAAVHKAAGEGFAPSQQQGTGDDAVPPSRSPAESLESFRAKPGLKVELVAAEPLLDSPVAVDFGGDGRLWVCEMRDYPEGIDGRGKPGGAVKVLEDRDRDGRYETATTFMDGLPFPTGVMAWRKGVLICAAPQIIYAEDTDGDGKADVKKTLFEGFATENFQARVNGLSYNLDNWVYGANGLIGGKIRGTASGRTVDIGGRDFRIQPDSGEFEPAAGLTQQGRTHDDWGNQFGGSNSVLIQHFPLPDHAARRNLRVAGPRPAVTLARGADPSRLFPASETLARYNHAESANQVTSACSPTIYRDTLLGAEYAGNAFVCEPVHNLVRRLVLEPDGVTFSGRRAEDEQASEFLASTDSWCRPVQVRTGPDGALWVVDMYRFVIEHPRWISPQRLASLDVRAGAGMGRIYRVVRADRPARPVAGLDAMSTPDLAAALDDPSGTRRDNVQRLLAHRADRAAAPVLAGLARSSSRPECRAQALGALDGIGALETADLLRALADPHPGVRRVAVRLCSPRLERDPALGRAVLPLAEDPAITVRFELALSLGDWSLPEASDALGRIAARDGNDPWVRAAVLSSSSRHAETVLRAVVAAAGRSPSPALVEPLVATIAGNGDRAAIARAAAAVAGGDPKGTIEPWRLGALAELFDAAPNSVLAEDPAVKRWIDVSRTVAGDRAARPGLRVAALRLLGRSPGARDSDRDTMGELLAPGEPAAVQLAAVRALAKLADGPSFDAILARWRHLGPAVRSGTLDTLLARPASAEALLSALERGRIASSEIDAAHREAMLSRGSADLRRRASSVFTSLAIRPRRAVLDAYASARTTPGDPERGRKTFERVCAACHKADGVGNEVGPDLAALTDTSPEALITAVLDPNREVDARYAAYTAALKDGRVLTGMIAAETASAVVLKRQGGDVDEVLRADLDDLATDGRSLMPEGLENDLKATDLADLVAYLGRTARPKELEGNRPRLVAAGDDGSIRLTAAAAEVYGPSLTFETEFGNLGYWHAANDRAAWKFRVDRPGTYTVSFEWACEDGSAGNVFQLRVGDRVVRATVPGTGGWSNYRSLFLGELTLPEGSHRLDMRPEGSVRGALADVRAIVLTPRANGRAGQPASKPASAPATAPRASADDVARRVLDPETPNAEREAILRDQVGRAAELVAAMTRDMPADRKEEYRRIPWIWRVAIAAGRRNDAGEIRRLLAIALPEEGRPLDHWRSVVVGGGIINGITQAGSWPGERIEALVADDPPLGRRWRRALELASGQADDAAVPNGTRYDALRMIGLEPWERRGAQLERYLARGVPAELQQGAVCALGDMPSPRVSQALLANLGHFTPAVRAFALEALARDDSRREALLDAIESGKIRAADLDDKVRGLLLDPARNRSHERAKKLLAP